MCSGNILCCSYCYILCICANSKVCDKVSVRLINNNAPRHFFNIIKQHGALLAKSRLAGVQFDALFTDGLYFHISRHAIRMALRLRQLFLDAGIPLKDSPTNQQFAILTQRQQLHLREKVLFETWEPIDADRTLCRFVTSWSTTDADMQTLADALQQL